MRDIIIVKSEIDLHRCYPIMAQLRLSYSEEEFIVQVKKQMQAGYQLVCVQSDGEICAVAGYRYLENLAWGKFLYVDDLITDNVQRSKGYGKYLFEWLIKEAKSNDCRELHLDSGVQRDEAHRFYKREGLVHSSHHFQITLES